MALHSPCSNSSGFLRLGLLAVLVYGCRPGDRRPDRNSVVQQAGPSDSRAASFGNGIEVWFTLSRAASGSGGKTCLERGIEIRRDQHRVQVPLLYTGEPPTLLNDSTMRAVLWNHCEPAQAYLVDLRTGRPVPERLRTNK